MSKKVNVYISSTFADLQEHREAVRQVLLRMGFNVIALEDFGASEAPPLDTCLNALASSDIVVLILAYRYGYIFPNENKSIIELEYEEAQKLNKPTLIFLLDENAPWPRKFIERGAGAESLEAFRSKLLSQHLVAFFSNPQQLASLVAASISQVSGVVSTHIIETEKPKAVTLDNIIDELRVLRSELSVLQQVVTQSNQSGNVSTFSEEGSAAIKPADFLGAAAKTVDYTQCFVIMPYSERWSAGLEKILSEICQEVGMKFIIAKTMEGRFIPYDIWRGITGSGIMIADLSGANPNVTYEVGLADVLGREVILICQGDKVPFDFLGQRLILYEDSISGTLKLREELSDRLKRFLTLTANLKESDGRA